MLSDIELFPMFQKIVKLDQTNRAFAHEALIRGQKKGGRVISPALLFQNAEANGEVQKLDFEARKLALRDSINLEQQGLLFLNCHGDSLNSGNIFESETSVPFDRIVLEISEQTRIRDIKSVVKNLQIYRDKGMKIALDDFGTGYSNFYLVEALNPEYIKLDCSLIRPLEESQVSVKVIAGLLAFASKTNCKLIAEGIETKGQLEILQSLGVHFGQGFLLGMPEKIESRLMTHF